MREDAVAGVTQPVVGPYFLPSFRQAVILACCGLAALGLAFYFRYALIQNTPLGLACEAGDTRFLCDVRFAVIIPFMWNVFGIGAVIAAVAQLWRPHVILFGTGLAIALLGLVLYNTRLSALALALLVLSLARSAPEAR